MKRNFLTKLTSMILVVIMIAAIVPAFAISIAAAEAYTLVTDASTLAAGDTIIIAAANANKAMNDTQESNNRKVADITKDTDANTVTFETTAKVQIITLAAGNKADTFAFSTEEGYLCAASSSKNYLRSEETLSDNSSWTIAIAADGVATIKAQGTYTRNWLRYNSSSSLFACYASGQADVVIYKLTEVVGGCEHVDNVGNDGLCDNCGECMGHNYVSDPNPTEATFAATCVADGAQERACEYCGAKGPTLTVPMLYHKYGTDGSCERTDCDATCPMSVTAGDVIYLTAENNSVKYELTGINTEKNVGDAASYISSAGKYPLTVEVGVAPDGFDCTAIFLKTANGSYLGYTLASGNTLAELSKEANDADNLKISWIPYVDNSGNFKLINAAETNRALRFNYNNGNPRFACYTSSQTAISTATASADPAIVNFSLSLNKGVTVKVNYFIPAKWLAENPGAQIVFDNNTTEPVVLTPIAGENVYSTTLTPAFIHYALNFKLQLQNGTAVTTNDVSVQAYSSTIIATDAADLGLTQAQKDALDTLLQNIAVYAEAANSKLLAALPSPFDTVTDAFAATGDIFTSLAGSLAEEASLKFAVDADKVDAAHTVTVKLGSKTIAEGAIADYITADNMIVVNGIYAADFDEVIEIVVSDGTSEVATATASFNAYLKAAYAEASDQNTCNLLIAAYVYGASTQAYLDALAA